MAGIIGNSINSVSTNARSVLATVGKAALHTLAPDLIEYYLCSLELIDSQGLTKGFMTFTIMPNSLIESKTQIATIQKTNTGVVSLFNDTFVPRDISIQGTFGRKFRLLIGMTNPVDVSTIPFFGGIKIAGQNVMVQTGYGMVKMLKNMCDQSWKLDSLGLPCILVFNNYALNTSYVVEVLQDSYQQSTENNMIWYYSLEMKAVAPGISVNGNSPEDKKWQNSNFLTTVAAGAIAKGVGNIINDSMRALNLGL